MCPLDSQTGSQVADSCLCSVVWCLWLWYINNGARHTSNEHNASWCISRHQVLCDSNCEKICAIDIDAPELADPVDRVIDGLEVLCESCRCDQVVNLAMLFDNLSNSCLNRFLRRYVGIMSGDSWNTTLLRYDLYADLPGYLLVGSWVLLSECLHELLCLLFGLLLC
jgi:hypothetical protein